MLLTIAQMHQVFYHFPIILFTGALICDLLYGIGKKSFLQWAHWLVIGGVILCIPTIVTGQEAAKAFDPQESLLIKHRLLGFSTGLIGSLYSGFRIAAMRWKFKIHPIFYVALSVLMVGLVYWTSDSGRILTHKMMIEKSD